VVDPWVVRGSRSSSLRLLNWLRAVGAAADGRFDGRRGRRQP
jgi:hypothetical protein